MNRLIYLCQFPVQALLIVLVAARQHSKHALPLEEKPIGGLGIHLIGKSVDELECRRAGNRNGLVMKYWRACP